MEVEQQLPERGNAGRLGFQEIDTESAPFLARGNHICRVSLAQTMEIIDKYMQKCQEMRARYPSIKLDCEEEDGANTVGPTPAMSVSDYGPSCKGF